MDEVGELVHGSRSLCCDSAARLPEGLRRAQRGTLAEFPPCASGSRRGVHRRCNCELHLRFGRPEGKACMAERPATRRDWQRVRDLASRLTTPLHPDDYLSMINPLWTTRELRGTGRAGHPGDRGRRHPGDPAGLGLVFDHQPGQYIGIGVEVDGPLPLAVLLAELGATPRPGHDHDHGPGDARGLPVRPPGARAGARHDRPARRPGRRVHAARPAAAPRRCSSSAAAASPR